MTTVTKGATKITLKPKPAGGARWGGGVSGFSDAPALPAVSRLPIGDYLTQGLRAIEMPKLCIKPGSLARISHPAANSSRDDGED
jgi:hypothetical protein